MAELDPTGQPVVGLGAAVAQEQQNAQIQPQQPTAEPSQPKPAQQELDPTGAPIQAQSKPDLKKVYGQVMNTDAAKNAQVQKLQKQTGLEPGYVASNTEEVQRAANSPSYSLLDEIQKSHPATSDWLNDPNNMAQVHDHVQELVKNESVWDDLYSGAAKSAKWINQLAKLPWTLIGASADKYQAIDENINYWDKEIKNTITPEADKDIQTAINQKDYAAIGAKLTEQIPNIALVGAGVEGLGVKMVAGLMGTQTTSEALEQSTKNGLSPTAASLSAGVKGATTAAGMLIPLGVFSKSFGPLADSMGAPGAKAVIKSAVGHWLESTMGMSFQSGSSTVGNAVADYVSGEDPKALEKLPHALASSELEGGLSGFALGALGAAGAVSEAKKPTTPEEKINAKADEEKATAEQGKQQFLNVVKAAKETPLTERNPEAMKDLLGKFQSQGPVMVHIPVEDFKVFHQSANEDPEEAARAMGQDAHQAYLDAEKTGGNVTVPLSDLVTRTTGKENLESLADDVKFNPYDKTVNEAKRDDEKNVELARQVQKEAETERTLNDYEKQLGEKIEAVGGKKSMAANITQFIRNMSERSGVPIDKLIQGYKFNFFKTKEPSFSELYEQAAGMGMASPADFLKKNKFKVLAETEEQLKQAKQAGIDATLNPETKGALSPSDIAQRLFDEANEGRIDRSHLPAEWWDEGNNGRPDAIFDTLHEIVRNGGSGVEDLKDLHSEGTKTLYQPKYDALNLSPEKQKTIFGISASQKYYDLLASQREKEGLMAALYNPKTGDIRTGAAHGEGNHMGILATIPEKTRGQYVEGFVNQEGKFITRQQAEKEHGVKVSDDLDRFKQDNRGEIRMAGTPGDRSFDIYIHEDADKSTFFHEPAHAFLEIFRDLSSQEGAPEDLKADQDKLFNWLGIKDWSELGEKQHEQFARGFEYRLWEGKTPVSGLRRVFDRFVQWMREVYPSSAIMEKYLGTKMSDEMRGVYDRMISTKDEIDLAEQEMGYDQNAPEGLTDKEMKMWKESHSEAKQATFDKIIKTKMSELTPTEHELYRKKLEETQDRVAKEVGELPVFQAEDYLTEKVGDVKAAAQRIIDGKPEGDDLAFFGSAGWMMNDSDDAVAVAKTMLEANRQTEIEERVKNDMAPYKTSSAVPQQLVLKAMHEGEAGEAYKDHIALEKALIQYRDIVEKGLEQIKASRLPEKPAPKAVTSIKEAAASSKTEPVAKEFGKQLKTELENLPEVKQLRKDAMQAALKQSRVDRASAKSTASKILSNMDYKGAQDYKTYVKLERDMAVKSSLAKGRGDAVKEYEYKQKQLLNSELATQAIKNQKIVPKLVQGIKKLGNLDEKNLNIPYGHWRTMKSLMESTGFKKPTPDQDEMLARIAKNLADKGSDPDEVADSTGMVLEDGKYRRERYDEFHDRLKKDDYETAARMSPEFGKPPSGKITLDALAQLKNTLSVIYAAGRENENVIIDGEAKSRKEFTEETIKQIANSVGTAYATDPREINETRDKINSFSSHVKNGALSLPQNLSEITGLGKFVSNLQKAYDVPLNTGADAELRNRREMKENFESMLDKHYSKEEIKNMSNRDKSTPIKIGGKNVSYTLTDRLILTRLMGSETGMDRLLNGNKFTHEDLKAITDSLSETDVKFLKDWNEFDRGLFDKMTELEMRSRNYEPKAVEKRPIQTQHGIIDGAYHPLDYNYNSVDGPNVAKAVDLEENQKPLNPFLNKGMLKGRVERYPYAIRFDMGGYHQHLEDVAKYLGFEEPLKTINKTILNNKEIQGALLAGFGPAGKQLYRDHANFVVHGDPSVMNANWIEQGIKYTRVANIAYHIAWRPFLLPMKMISDLRTIATEPGMGVGEIGSVLSAMNPMSFKLPGIIKDVTSKSEFMRERVKSGLNYEIYATNELLKNWESPVSKVLQICNYTNYIFESVADMAISHTVWKDAYDKLKGSESTEEEAIALANDHIGKMFGSGTRTYQTYLQHGPEIVRQLFPAISYYQAQLNRAITLGRIDFKNQVGDTINEGQKRWIAAKITARQVLMYGAVAGVLEETIRHYLYKRPEQQEKEGVKDMLANGVVKGVLSMAPGGQKLSDAVQYPRMAEQMMASIPTGEFAADMFEATSKGVKAMQGKSLTDRDLDDIMGGPLEAFGMPKRIDDAVVNLHNDYAHGRAVSWYDLAGPIRSNAKETRRGTMKKMTSGRHQ